MIGVLRHHLAQDKEVPSFLDGLSIPHYACLVSVAWCLIFDPPLMGPLSLLLPIAYVAWIYLCLNRAFDKRFICVELAFAFFGMYLSIISVLNGKSISAAYSFAHWAIEVVPIAYFLTIHLKKREVGLKGFVSILIGAAILESLFVYLALFNVNAHTQFIQMIIASGTSSSEFFEEWSFRSYGLASNLQYSSPIVLAIASLFAFSRWLDKGSCWLLIISVALIPAAAINARTSLMIIVIGYVCLSLVRFMKKGMIKGVIVFVIATVAMYMFVKYAPLTQQTAWIKNGLSDILSIFGFQSTYEYSTFSYFSNDSPYRLPNDLLALLFGTGSTIVYGSSLGTSSDIGFVNDIWLGGIVYTAAMGVTLIVIVKMVHGRLIQINKTTAHSILLIFIICFVVGNMKGIFLSFNNVSTTWILLTCFILFEFEEKRDTSNVRH